MSQDSGSPPFPQDIISEQPQTRRPLVFPSPWELLWGTLFRALLCLAQNLMQGCPDPSHAFIHYPSSSCSEPTMPEILQKSNKKIMWPDSQAPPPQTTQVLPCVCCSRCVLSFRYECGTCNHKALTEQDIQTCFVKSVLLPLLLLSSLINENTSHDIDYFHPNTLVTLPGTALLWCQAPRLML